MWRWVRRTLLGLVLALIILVIAVGLLSRSVPTWYQPPSPVDPQVAQLAEDVEKEAMNLSHEIRPADEPWAVRVREHQVNAWLAVRLPEWIAHEKSLQWPKQLGTPQLRIESERVHLALPILMGDHQRVVIAKIAPEVRDDLLWLHLEGIALGSIVVPGDPLAALTSMIRSVPAEQLDDASWQHVMDILTGREPVEPVLQLSDDRRVRLLDIRCAPGALDLTSTTLSAPKKAHADNER